MRDPGLEFLSLSCSFPFGDGLKGNPSLFGGLRAIKKEATSYAMASLLTSRVP